VGIKEVTLTFKEFIMSDFAKINRDKAKSQGFAALGIPVGSTLVFKKDDSVTAKTLDDKNKVEYQGKPYSISTLAKQLVGSPVSGYLYFKFEGKVLKSLMKNEPKPTIPESAESPVPPSEETAESSVSAETGEVEAAVEDIDPLAGESEADAAEIPPNEAGTEV
jgi:hypothetical protein